MPVIAFMVGLVVFCLSLFVLLTPLVALYAVTVVIALGFGVVLNGALAMGVAVLILPAIIYLPIVFFSFALPALSRLIAHFGLGLFTKEDFTIADALATISHFRRRSLSLFGLARRPSDLGS